MDKRAKPPPPATERALRYRALSRHDPAYDGRFYIGVTSTGIYCRPVCPVRVPKLANCTFHERPAAAEKAGFRPCLVCRPELAPGTHLDDSGSPLARLALRRIEDGALNTLSVEDFAAEFGVSARHLRRELTAAYGVSPVELAQTQRLLQAKQLLTETDLSITEVAFTAGFDSLRRFNALFKSRYRMAPGALRKRAAARSAWPDGEAEAGAVTIRIDYRPPYNWERMLAFLAARAIPGVEAVLADSYVRTAQLGEHRGWVAVRPWHNTSRKRDVHALSVSVSAGLRSMTVPVIVRMKALFDTRAETTLIDRHLAHDVLLRTAVADSPGQRLPGAFDGFELLLRAILGQQVSVKGATTLSGRVASMFGTALPTPWPALNRLTPDPLRIARAPVERIAGIGMPRKRAATIRAAAEAYVAGELRLLPGTDPERARTSLLSIAGIGEWTAAYVAMRALAMPDALIVGDLGVNKALGLRHPRDVLARTALWRPYRAYGVMYAWSLLAGQSGG